MKPEELISRSLARKVHADRSEIHDLLLLSERDIEVAESLLGSCADWAEAIAYNSMLRSGRALMLFRGLMPRGPSHHLAVLWFLEGELGAADHDLVISMSAVRKRRNAAVYVRTGGSSRGNAEDAIVKARALLSLVAHIAWP